MAAIAVVVLLVVATQLPLGLTSPSTVPAFLWSPHLNGMKELVDYRIISPKELAKSVMTEGEWSNYLCSGEKSQQTQDFAFLFVGSELQSLDISRPRKADQALVGFLKDSVSNSNFSLAFPYVATQEKASIESSLITEFTGTCQHNLGTSNVALMGSCTIDGENFDKLEDINSVDNYMQSKMEKDSNGQTNLIVLCQGDQPQSESIILTQLLSSAEKLGARYTVLYVSDPLKSIQYQSNRGLERFLAEGTVGNGSVKSIFCDGLCQIKSSLLEGIFVGLVLLVILISGLCCMMGIDTPTRFETPQDS